MKVEITPTETTSAAGGTDERSRNMEMARANRQIVFKGDCASCHATPTIGKTGEALYRTACAICHDSPNRASMVPDLARLPNKMGKEYWKSWIAYGKVGSLMPAFRQGDGGPLTEDQITSLAEYLVEKFPGQTTTTAERKFSVE